MRRICSAEMGMSWLNGFNAHRCVEFRDRGSSPVHADDTASASPAQLL